MYPPKFSAFCDELWPQMFFGGLQTAVIGVRMSGHVIKINKLRADEVLSNCKMTRQDINDGLQRVVGVLEHVASRIQDKQKLSLLYEPTESPDLQLLVRPTTAEDCLPSSCHLYEELLRT
eukprot:TRINITY_DN13144_c0_g1_i1.p2 TRINITY_DN13144_c0_g1~~TRINITY_DN13144_c0_g1_i1.p2  ORF type:complete len:120 (+),score=33.80 TRINITY_DN13144_c0_g1_i1:3-362(+)